MGRECSPASASTSQTNPNCFNSSAVEIGKIFKDPRAPLLNRALNVYAPGSIFKIVTAYSALKEHVINEHTTFECRGEFQLGNSKRSCWLKRGHGVVELREAIATSCNVFFWEVGMKLGQRLLSQDAKIFGIGKVTGIDLPGEKAGTLPNSRWKQTVLHDKWYGGDTANFAIGQGYLLVSPVQAVRYVSMFANGGYEVKPHIVVDPDKENIRNNSKPVLSAAILDIIKQGMFDVVSSPKGTGKNAHIPDVKIYAKTGTAQAGSNVEPHAWFLGYAELDYRKISFCVFEENGGHGGEGPAVIAKQIILYCKNKYGKTNK